MFQGMSGHAEARLQRVALMARANFILSFSKQVMQ
jgi:hypothetical protein